MLLKDKAICIRKTDYSETSQIVVLLTREHGKISAIAKGSRRSKSKSFGGAIGIFSYGEIIFSLPKTGNLATLTEFDQLPVFIHLQRKLESLNAALFAVEIVNSLTEEHDPHRELFDLLEQYLYDLQEAKSSRGALEFLIVFQLSLLDILGVGLVFNRCTNCKQKFSSSWSEVYFCSDSNGFVCRDCEAGFVDKLRLPIDVANLLAQPSGITAASGKVVHYVEKLLIRHLTYLLHKPPRMAKYFV